MSDTAWFGNVAATMTRYCQFWNASCTLEECAPNNSAAGAVSCQASAGDIFNPPAWIAQAGDHSSHQHGDPNAVGHYQLASTATLTVRATTTVPDIPDAHIFAATTYHMNVIPQGRQSNDFQHGQFWTIAPNAFSKRSISVYQGVLSTITREYHSETRIAADQQ